MYNKTVRNYCLIAFSLQRTLEIKIEIFNSNRHKHITARTYTLFFSSAQIKYTVCPKNSATIKYLVKYAFP